MNKPKKLKPPKEKIIDVFLVDRMEAIKAVAAGIVPPEAASVNLWEFRKWAIDTHQPDGIINGVNIVTRKGER